STRSESVSQLFDLSVRTPKLWKSIPGEVVLSRKGDAAFVAGTNPRVATWPDGALSEKPIKLVDQRVESFFNLSRIGLVKWNDKKDPWSLWQVGQPTESARPIPGFEIPPEAAHVAVSVDGKWAAIALDSVKAKKTETQFWDISGEKAVLRQTLPVTLDY